MQYTTGMNDSGQFYIPFFVLEEWFSTNFLNTRKYLNDPKVLIGDNLLNHLSLEILKLSKIHNNGIMPCMYY